MSGAGSPGSVPPPRTSGGLAQLVHGELIGPADLPVRGVNALDDAAPDEATFIDDAAHAARWSTSRARVAILAKAQRAAVAIRDGCALIIVPDAQLALAALLATLEPPPDLPDVGAHPSAVVDPTVKIGAGVRIGPHVSIGPHSVLGANSVIHPGVRLGSGVIVGSQTTMHSNCVVRDRCEIGARVVLHQNVCVGADGFGYRPCAEGRNLVKLPHVGIVIIEDDVEIGAGTCVDRAKFGATVVGRGTKIDNLCQIGHNCRIGRSCVIAGLTALAGSVTVGDGAMIAGQVAIAEHVHVGDGARIGGGSGVMRDIPAGETHLGYPAESMVQTLRQWAATRKLPGLLHRLAGRG